ncbi:spermidine synthase [Gammaproteobacteria bacterium 45_16_T64]|nr:spermidine synthase [Gammaproteobacteria bacterium 45_16_T64]
MSLLGKEIYRCYDEYGPIQVFDDGIKRYLAFEEDDEQTCVLKEDPGHIQHEYTRAMLLSLLFVEPTEVLLLGLGGGSLATCLLGLNPELRLRAVELRRSVIKIAKKYFYLPKTDRLTVIEDDAGQYLLEPDVEPAQLILADMYGADGLDPQQLTSWFLERCHELLMDDGWLVLNCWNDHRKDKETLKMITDIFADVRVSSTTSGNWIIFAGKQINTQTDKQLGQKAKVLGDTLNYSVARYSSQLKKIS